MKNRLSTLLMIFLSAFLFACGGGTSNPKPTVNGRWNIVSVTSSIPGGILPKYDAVLGLMELPTTSGPYSITTAAGVITPGGTGTAISNATDVKLDGIVTFAYSNLTATSVTLIGRVNDPTESVGNNHTIVLKR